MNRRRLIGLLRASILFRWHGIEHGGRPLIVGAGLKFDPRGQIVVGFGFASGGRQFPGQIGAGPDGRLTIGTYFFMNQGVFIFAAESVTIGDHTRFADLVFLTDTNFHEVCPDEPLRFKPVAVGSNVWVGMKVTILPGSKIGDHSVVAAGSVVRGEIPAKCIAAGNPARPVKYFECSDDWVRP